jgi:hypothetical protein
MSTFTSSITGDTARAARTRAATRTLRWIVLLPVLMVGSLLYWSVAIGLGGLSLMTASALSATNMRVMLPQEETDTGEAMSPLQVDVGDGMVPAGTIMVHLEESVEPEDVNDNAGAAGFTVPTPTDDQQVIVTPGPGSTSY